MSVFSREPEHRIAHKMKWKVIRLELASNGEFPRGSAGRAYLLRVPLNDDGIIDGDLLDDEPDRAVVRRYWANEADKIGYLVRTPSGLAIRYEANQDMGGRLFPVSATPIRIGEQLLLTDVDGRELPFRVANLA